MDKLAFAPLIDVPFVCVLIALFVWNFNRWAVADDADTTVDLSQRLPTARWRVIALFGGILAACWFLNFSAWSVFAFIMAVGFGVAMLFGESAGEFAPLVTAYIIREWAFGFPQLILQPPSPEATRPTAQQESELIGKSGITTSPLRPIGDAEIDGTVMSVSAHDGSLLDEGTEVTIVAYRNGQLRVQPSQHGVKLAASIEA